MTNRTTPSLRYAEKAEHNGVNLRLIGEWIDLAAYYAGDDGNVWCFNACTGTFSNKGEIEPFRANFERMYRGSLFA